MRRTMKKSLSLLLSLVLIFTLVPVSFADNPHSAPARGTETKHFAADSVHPSGHDLGALNGKLSQEDYALFLKYAKEYGIAEPKLKQLLLKKTEKDLAQLKAKLLNPETHRKGTYVGGDRFVDEKLQDQGNFDYYEENHDQPAAESFSAESYSDEFTKEFEDFFTPKSPQPRAEKPSLKDSIPNEYEGLGDIWGGETSEANSDFGFHLFGTESQFELQKTATQNEQDKMIFDMELRIKAKPQKNTDVVLVLDRSGSMRTDRRIIKAKEAANAFVDALIETSGEGRIKVGLVTYATDVTVNQGLTNDKDALKAAIAGIGIGGETFIQGGIYEARKMLQSSTAQNKIMVVISDGEPTRAYSINNFRWVPSVAKPGSNTKRYPDGIMNPLTSDPEQIPYVEDDGGVKRLVSPSTDSPLFKLRDTKANVPESYMDYGFALPNLTFGLSKVADNANLWEDPFTLEVDDIDVINIYNQTISESKIARTHNINIYAVGIDLGTTGQSIMDAVGGGKSYASSAGLINDHLAQIAGDLSYVGKEVRIGDPAGDVFDLVGDNGNDTFTDGAIRVVNKNGQELSPKPTITWNSATKTFQVYIEKIYEKDSPIRVIYQQRIKDGTQPGQTYKTNGITTITYTDRDGQTHTQEFDVPEKEHNQARYKLRWEWVDEAGQPQVKEETRVGTLGEWTDIQDDSSITTLGYEQESKENVAITADERATATIKYKKRVATFTVIPGKVLKYNGEVQAVEGFTVEPAGNYAGAQGGEAIRATGSAREVGTHAFRFTVKPAKVRDASGKVYFAEYVDGTFEIVKGDASALALSAGSASLQRVYDGTAFGVPASVKADETSNTTITYRYRVPGGNWIDAGSSFPTITDAGSIEVEATAQNPNYETAKITYTVTVTKRPLTIKTGSAEKPFDGKPLTMPDGVQVDGFVQGENAFVTVTGTQTYPGKSSNFFTVTWNANAKESNYEVKETHGILRVKDREPGERLQITLESNSLDVNYDEKPHTVSGFKQTEFEIGGVKFRVEGVTANVTQTEPGSYQNTINSANMKIVFDDSGKDVKNQFDVELVPGTLNIKAGAPGDIGINPPSVLQRKYDGTLFAPEASPIGGVSLEYSTDHNVWSSTVPGLTDAGTKTIYVRGKKQGYKTIEINYTIEVLPRTVVITSKGTEKNFDGTALTIHEFESDTADGFLFADVPTYTFSGKQVQPGSSKNLFDYKLQSHTNAANYNITKKYGTLKVNSIAALDPSQKLLIALVSNGKTVDFNGSEQSVDGVEKLSFRHGETDFIVEGLQTGVRASLPGSYKNAIDLSGMRIYFIDDQGRRIYVDNPEFNVTVEEKFLVIRPASGAAIGLKEPAKKEHIYDGQNFAPQATTSVGAKIQYSIDGGNNWFDEMPPLKDVDSYTVKARATKDGHESVEIGPYTVKVLPRRVTLTSDTAARDFNGKALTNHIITVTGEGFAPGEGADYTVTGMQLLPGTSTNRFDYTLNGSTKDINYIINAEFGTLTVNSLKDKSDDDKLQLTLESGSTTATYDGTAKTASGLVTTTFTVGDIQVSVVGATAGRTETNVGNYTNTIDTTNAKVMYYPAGGSEQDLTAQFHLNKIEGTLIINKASADGIGLTLPTELEKTYDGKPFAPEATAPGAVIKYKGPNDATFSTTPPSFTDAGTYVVEVIAEKDGFEPKKTSYTVVIKKRNLTLKSEPAQKLFDGTPLTNATVTATGDGFADGEGATYNVTGSQVIPGASKNTFEVNFNVGTKQTNYNVSIEEGTLTVQSRTTDPAQGKLDLTLTSETKEFEYDGSEKTAKGPETTYRVGSIDVVLEGVVSGVTKTLPGDYPNLINTDNLKIYTMIGSKKEDLTEEFKIIKKEGHLKITPKSGAGLNLIVPSNPSDLEKLYDGTPLAPTATANGTVWYKYPGSDWTQTPPSLKDAGTLSVEVKATKDGYEDATGSYTLTVRKRNLTLTSATDQKDFDGTPLTKATVTPSEDGFAPGEGADYTVTGTQLLPGSSPNSFDYVLNGGAKPENYNITKTEGTLTVNSLAAKPEAEKLQLTLESGSATATYDGSPKTASGLVTTTFTVGDIQVTVVDATAGVSQINVGTYTNTIDTTNAKVMYYPAVGSEQDLTAQFHLDKKEGKLIINKASASEIGLNLPTELEKMYDGKPFAPAATAPGAVIKYKGPNDSDFGPNPPNFTDAGTYVVEVIAEKDGYEPMKTSYTVVIKKRKVTLTSATRTKDFDGTPLTDATVTATEDGFADGEGATYDVTGTQLLPGKSENKFTYLLNAGTKPENYEIAQPVFGTLTVNSYESVPEDNRPLIITLQSNSKTELYDGTEKRVDGLMATEFPVSNLAGAIKVQVEGVTAEGKGTEPGDYTNKIDKSKIMIYFMDGSKKVDLTKQFKVLTQEGILKIEAKEANELGFAAQNASRPYNGDPFAVGATAQVPGTKIEYMWTGSGNLWTTEIPAPIDAGVYEITARASMVGYKNPDPIAYKITVTPRNLTFTSKTDSKDFDGTPLKKPEVEITGDGFVKSEGVNFTVTGQALLPGEEAMNSFTYALKDGAKPENYNITTSEGKLTVNSLAAKPDAEKLQLEIKSKSETLMFDGSPKVAEGFDQLVFTVGEIAVEIKDVTARVEKILPETYPNEIQGTPRVVYNGGAGEVDLTAQFHVTKSNGQLIITKRDKAELNLQVPDAAGLTRPYNGKKLQVPATAMDGASIRYSVDGGINWTEEVPFLKDVAKLPIKVKATKVGYEDSDILDYEIEVTPKRLVLASNGAEKAFDGTPLKTAIVTVDPSFGFVAGEGADYAVTGAQTLIGESDNIFDIVAWTGGAKPENYKLEKTYGKLAVKSRTLYPSLKKIPLLLKAKSAKVPYDATLLKVDGFEETSFRIGDIDVQVTGALAHGEGIEVGTYPSKVDASKLKVEYLGPGLSQDLTAEFEVTTVDGVLEIIASKRPSTDSIVTVVTDDESGSGGSGASGGSADDTTNLEEDTTPLGKLNNVDHFAYIQGYPDGSVRPNGLLTREEVAAVFFRILDKEYREEIRSMTNTFTDMEPDRWSAKHVSTLAKGRIIRGYKDGSYRPSNSITRAELAAIASRFDSLEVNAQHNFSDMSGHWAEKYVASAVQKGWVNGYEDATFKPDQFVTRAEFVSFVNNVLNRHVKVEDILPEAQDFTDLRDNSKWYYGAMKAATNSYLFEDVEGSENTAKKYQKWTELIHPTIEM